MNCELKSKIFKQNCGDVVSNILSQMETHANATQLHHTRAALMQAGVEILICTANVLDAMTSEVQEFIQ